MEHTHWMKEALKEAELAKEEKEVPIGAVIVLNDRIIGRGHNQVESLKDPTAHAEIIAITSASHSINNWRLNNATLYVTLEPCPMCAGAIFLSRISRCVFGAKDPKLGSLGSVYEIKSPEIKIISGVLESECKKLLKSFFKNKRV
ncbi:tRNA adenosine(34) deaminase TadA [candidate division WOR-3 bacterium]|nr:tRNA adenosine(34) deaminase TadA [candidate division WOR-3 bacterium]